MKLKRTEEYLKEGIKLSKLINAGFWQNTYDHKTVYDIEEALELSANGWYFDNLTSVMQNMTLMIYRDLKNKAE